MPFKSEAQRRYLWANEPEIARDWTETYGSKIHAADGGIMRIPFRTGHAAEGQYGGGSNPSGGHGGGGEGNRHNPHTDTGTSKTSTVTGDRMRSSERDFIQTLNTNNAIRAAQTGTKFTPYKGGSRPKGGMSGLGSLLTSGLGMLMGIPGLGLITGGLSKLGNLANLRGFNPDGTRRTQQQYEEARYNSQQQKRLDKLFAAKDRGYNQIGFGDFTKKTMDFTPGQQAKIDALMAEGYTPTTARNVDSGRSSGLRGDLNNVESLINATNLNDYEGYDLGLKEVPGYSGYNIDRFNNPVGPVPPEEGIMGIDTELINDYDPEDRSTWFDTHPASGEAVLKPETGYDYAGLNHLRGIRAHEFDQLPWDKTQIDARPYSYNYSEMGKKPLSWWNKSPWPRT